MKQHVFQITSQQMPAFAVHVYASHERPFISIWQPRVLSRTAEVCKRGMPSGRSVHISWLRVTWLNLLHFCLYTKHACGWEATQKNAQWQHRSCGTRPLSTFSYVGQVGTAKGAWLAITIRWKMIIILVWVAGSRISTIYYAWLLCILLPYNMFFKYQIVIF